MSKAKKFVILGFTLYPVGYIIYFMSFMFSMVARLDDPSSMGAVTMFQSIFVLHILAMLIMMVILAIYAIHLVKNKYLKDEMRIVWAILLFFGNMITMPVYWYMHIWKEPQSRVLDSTI